MFINKIGMLLPANVKQLIKESLEQSDVESLVQEVRVSAGEMAAYLGQIVANLSREVAPGVLVTPLTGGLQLQDVIGKYNKAVLASWMKGASRRFSGLYKTKDTIQEILQSYDRLELLAINL